jgi:hypothetical protein
MKVGAAFTLPFVAVPAWSQPAQAASGYSCYGGGYPSRTFNVRYLTTSGDWPARFNTARKRFNDAGVGANIGYNNQAAAWIEAKRYNNDWFAECARVRALSIVTAFHIKINTKTIGAGAPAGKYEAWVTSTATHELGHALRLNDNPSTSQSSLMKHDRDRSKIGSPTSYDKNNVRECY